MNNEIHLGRGDNHKFITVCGNRQECVIGREILPSSTWQKGPRGDKIACVSVDGCLCRIDYPALALKEFRMSYQGRVPGKLRGQENGVVG